MSSPSRVSNPFARPSASPANPEVLELSDFRPSSATAELAVVPEMSTASASAAGAPVVAPKPLPPPEMEEKKIRVSVKLTAAEHWDLKRRIAGSNMGVDEYLRALLFPTV
jgi:hypothetical protein